MGALENGEPVICSMRPGDFTTKGHFIVLVGMEDGKIRVQCPAQQPALELGLAGASN